MSNNINPINTNQNFVKPGVTAAGKKVDGLVSDVQGKLEGVKADFALPGDSFTIAKGANGETVTLDQYGEQV